MDAYGKDLEFCQIQLNYLDYKFQHAKEKVELIKQYGLPVWVMEPLRGGKLATVDDKYAAGLTALRPDESVPGWGFRFLQSIPEVTMVLSGMSNLQQLADNIRIFSEDKPLDSHELTALTGIADKMIGETALPCTGCRYCGRMASCTAANNKKITFGINRNFSLTFKYSFFFFAHIRFPFNKEGLFLAGVGQCLIDPLHRAMLSYNNYRM